MGELATTDKYIAAQLLICGAIDVEEFRTMNDCLPTVQFETLSTLSSEDVMDTLLLKDE